MNILYRIYFAIPSFAFLGLSGKAIHRVMGMILKKNLDAFVPAYLKRTANKAGHGLNTKPRDETYIVSLTSFPARINDIWITIETILRQSFKPDKIILWLGKDQFPSGVLPESLTKLIKRGLTIEFVDDLRSHTKYFYAFQNYPECNIITLDDDNYYPSNILKNLVKLHEDNPEEICANRVHKMTFGKDGIRPYRKWKHNYMGSQKTSNHFLLTGVSGVLYPPQSVSKELLKKEVFKKLCFFADDVWLTVHAIRNGTKIRTGSNFNKDLISVSKTQRVRLVTNNSHGGGNDQQLQNICDYYNINLSLLNDSQ